MNATNKAIVSILVLVDARESAPTTLATLFAFLESVIAFAQLQCLNFARTYGTVAGHSRFAVP